MDQQGAGHSGFFSPPNPIRTHDGAATTFTPIKTHDGAMTTFTPAAPSQSGLGPMYAGSHTPRPRPRFGHMVAQHTEDEFFSMNPRYPHLGNMNYNPPAFHDPSSLPHSPVPQPAMDQSVYSSTGSTIRSHIATSINNQLPLGSDDEQFGLATEPEPKPKKSKQKPTKASGKTRKGDATKAKAGGRPQGSRNFQAPETQMLLRIIEDRVPIGGDSWQVVAAHYNSWARTNEFKERDKKSLKQKFDTLIQTAHEKPTGTGERDALLTKALELEEAINTRASTVTLGDAELASSGDSGVLNAGDDAVEISDSDVDMQVKNTRAKARGPAGKSAPVAKVMTTKNYRVSDPLGPDNSKKPPRGMAIATGALEKITTFFDPGNRGAVVKKQVAERIKRSINWSCCVSSITLVINIVDATLTHDLAHIQGLTRILPVDLKLKLELGHPHLGPTRRADLIAVAAVDLIPARGPTHPMHLLLPIDLLSNANIWQVQMVSLPIKDIKLRMLVWGPLDSAP
ncbi:hypothetical protein F5887DRAFT_1076965 [Amanita rubescens]|nr:hypothetical protein F5887DRAFT_1076965 [Amanita rubescens]